MDNNTQEKDVLCVHIQHSKPVNLDEFTASLKAISSLYSSYVRKHGGSEDVSRSKLYVESVHEGSIIVCLTELVTASLIPFMENANVIMEFASYLKGIYGYFASEEGPDPELTPSECEMVADSVSVIADDPKGSIGFGVCKNSQVNITQNNYFYDCGSDRANSVMNRTSRYASAKKEAEPETGTYQRVLMSLYQIRTDNSGKGNKAIIDDIAKGKRVNLLFASDYLRDAILYSDDNPTRKAYQVDVSTKTMAGKIVAYEVTALHDVIDLEE